MPEVKISIGGKDFTVACQPGEEDYLHGAAGMLDREASQLVGQIGKLPDHKLLLMAGLMLADRTAAYEEKVAQLERQLAEGGSGSAARGGAAKVPDGLADALGELAAQAEATADALEAQVSS